MLLFCSWLTVSQSHSLALACKHTLSHTSTHGLSLASTRSLRTARQFKCHFYCALSLRFFFAAAAAALLNGSCANSICRERERKRMGERGRAPVGTGIRVRDLSAGTNANKSLVNRTRVFLTFSTRVFIPYARVTAF